MTVYHPPTVDAAIGIAVVSLMNTFVHAVAWQTGRISRKKFPDWVWGPEHWVGSVGLCGGAPVLFAYALAALNDQVTDSWSLHTEALRLLPYYLSAGMCTTIGFTINTQE